MTKTRKKNSKVVPLSNVQEKYTPRSRMSHYSEHSNSSSNVTKEFNVREELIEATQKQRQRQYEAEMSVSRSQRRTAMANIIKDVVVKPNGDNNNNVPGRVQSIKAAPMYVDEIIRKTNGKHVEFENALNTDSLNRGYVRNLSYSGTDTKTTVYGDDNMYLKPHNARTNRQASTIATASKIKISHSNLALTEANLEKSDERYLTQTYDETEMVDTMKQQPSSPRVYKSRKGSIYQVDDYEQSRMQAHRPSIKPELTNYPSFFLRKMASKRHSGLLDPEEHGMFMTKTKDYLSCLPIVVPTSSRWLPYWIMTLVTFALYDAILVPFRCAFGTPSSPYTMILLTIDIFSDLVFAMNFVLCFRLAYFIHSTVVKNPKRIADRYIHSWMIPDILALLPLDLIQFAFGTWIPALRLGKLLRLSLIFRYNIVNMHHSSATPGVDNKQGYLQYVFKLIVLMLMTGHFIACIKYLLQSHEGLYSWSEATYYDLDTSSRWRRYLISLLWTLNILTGLGSNEVPDSYLENFYTNVVMLFGMLMFAYIVGKTGSILNMSHVNRHVFQEKLHYLGRFMTQNHLPLPLQHQLTRYFNYVWTMNRGLDSTTVTNRLLLTLRTDVRAHLYRSAVEQSYLFRDVEPGFIRCLVNELYSVVCVPNQFIISSGSFVADKMYFIKEGTVHILIGTKLNQHVVKTLSDGDHFGEYALLGMSGKKRSASARAHSYCTLIVLEKDRLLKLMSYFPITARIIIERCQANWSTLAIKDQQFMNDEVKFLFGSVKGWAKIRRYVFLQKLVNWMKRKETGPRVFHPSSPMIVRWKTLILCIFLWNAVSIPFRCAFTFHYAQPWVITLDILLDLCLWCDMVVNTRTAYLERGVYVFELKQIRHHYLLSKTFIIHLLTALPLDLFMIWVGMNPLLRLNRLLGMVSLFVWMQKALEGSSKFYFFNFLKFCCSICLTAHWTACIYFSFTHFRGYSAVTDDAWLPHISIETAPRMHQYLRSTFFSFAILTGFSRHPNPMANSEIIFTIVLMIVGVFLIANLISSMSSVLANMDLFAERFSRQVNMMDGFMSTCGGIGKPLRKRIAKYYVHLWHAHHGVDPNMVLDSLPKPLRTSVSMHIFGQMLQTIPQFTSLQLDIIEDISHRLRVVEVPPGELIFKVGDYGRHMYFILHGLVELIGITDRNGEAKRYKEIARCSFFGEIALMNDQRLCDARAMTPCTVLQLSRTDFYELAQAHNSFNIIMNEVVRKRTENLVSHGYKTTVQKSLPEDILLKHHLDNIQEKKQSS